MSRRLVVWESEVPTMRTFLKARTQNHQGPLVVKSAEKHSVNVFTHCTPLLHSRSDGGHKLVFECIHAGVRATLAVASFRLARFGARPPTVLITADDALRLATGAPSAEFLRSMERERQECAWRSCAGCEGSQPEADPSPVIAGLGGRCCREPASLRIFPHTI